MSTPIQETTRTKTTTSVTTPPLAQSNSNSSSSSTAASSASTSQPSLAQQINQGITAIGDSASNAIKAVDERLGVSAALSDFDSTHHVSGKVTDAASHFTAAINRGNPLHAVSNVGTAAMIGDAERAKHEKGPLAGSMNEAAVEPKEHTDYHPDPTQHKTSNQLGDVSDHVKASLAHGNIVHAAKYAGAATVIGQAEREKHERGPLPEQLVDQPEAEHVNVPAGHVKHAP